MEKEIVDYIMDYSSHLMTKEEALAWRHYETLFKRNKKDIYGFSENTRAMLLKNEWVTDNEKVLALLQNGIEAFRENTARRILEENGGDVVFNNCQKCGGLARTPMAKQCRFCGYDWH